MVHPNGSPSTGICHQRNALKQGKHLPAALPSVRSGTSQQTSALVSVRASIVNRQKRMKGSLMTENPVPGASPKPTQQNQDPAGAQEGAPRRSRTCSAQPHDSAQPDAAPGAPAPGNPTLRLDHAEDGAPRPGPHIVRQHGTARPVPVRTVPVRPGPLRRALRRPAAVGSVLRFQVLPLPTTLPTPPSARRRSASRPSWPAWWRRA